MNLFESAFKAIQKADREYFYEIWQKAQKGQLEELDDEEKFIAKIMLDHDPEFFNQFTLADMVAECDFDPASEIDLFLHIALHAVLEKQVNDRDPWETYQFYKTMLKKKCSHHEAIHLLMVIFAKFLIPLLNQKGKFNLQDYERLLKVYKELEPDEIFSLFDNELDFPANAEISKEELGIINELRSAMKGKSFASAEEAQTFLQAWMQEKNAQPLPQFLGLSPEQMYRILNFPFSEVSDMVVLNKDLPREKILEIPIVKEVVYFLRRLAEMQPLKATKKGNLPRAFVYELHDRFPEYKEFVYPVKSEEEDRKLWALRHILEMCGWIKKRNQKFYLTKKGENLNEKGFSSKDFYHLFQTYTQKFNWAFRDLYGELEIIQLAFLFSCYVLYRKAKTYIKVGELAKYFRQAFPAEMKAPEEDPFAEDLTSLFEHCFYIRFIERFCEYFGLVTIQKKGKGFLDFDHQIKTTPFFEEMFQWKL
ncbi:MAG: DUF1841 family protein [Thermodesulfobacteriota bacterium]